MTSAPALTVVVAIENSMGNLDAVIAALAPQAHPTVQFILGYASDSESLPAAATGSVNVKSIVLAPGKRIPHIWAEGIRQSDTPYVGLLTGQFVPRHDWVAQALALHWEDSTAACGGLIHNKSASRAMDWAIYILRYGRFAALGTPGPVTDIAADNAVYRRDLIIGAADLLERGFWEPDFHAHFHHQGYQLVAAPELVAEQHNLYSAAQFAEQRFEHGTEFGSQRAISQTTPWRLAMLAISPALPFVFLAKIVASASANPQCKTQLLRSFPWLVIFLACWGAGEARGYWRALRNTTEPADNEA